VLNGIPSAAVASPVESGLNFSADNNGHFSDNEVTDVTLTVDWDMDGFSLTSVTGFVEYEFDENCDCDFSGAAIFDAARQEEYEQFSQEFRFTSDLGGDFDYIGGLFFQSTELNYKDQISLPSPTLIADVLGGIPTAVGLVPFAPGASTDRSFNQEGDLWAAFAQGSSIKRLQLLAASISRRLLMVQLLEPTTRFGVFLPLNLTRRLLESLMTAHLRQ
jgi:iron complex outermembrane receptor protein